MVQFSNVIGTVGTKPLHEAMDIVLKLCLLQVKNIPCAIPNLVGDGGIGKTASIKYMCNKYNLNLVDIHYGLKPLEEISGIPDFAEEIIINNKKVKNTIWTLPDIVGQIWNVYEYNKELNKDNPNFPNTNIVFLDDFHISSPGVMALGYEIFTEKRLRNYDFPPNTAFVLAMNQSGSKSLANPIPAPIVNRMALLKVKPDFNYWKETFALSNNINTKVLSFLSRDINKKYFQEEEIVNQPWSSVRSWCNLSNLINIEEENSSDNLDFDYINYISSSHIGYEAANEFALYYKIFSEIDVKSIFDEKINIDINSQDNISKKYTYIIACISEFMDRYKKDYDNKKTGLEKKESALNIMSLIIIKFVEKQTKELAVMALKEILLLEKNHNKKITIYPKLISNIKNININIYNKLLDSIDKIGG